MNEQLNWTRDGNTLKLAGELDSETVQTLWAKRDKVMSGVQSLDLSDLSRVDTAGVALLIHLIAQARKQGTEMRLSGASDKLQTLVQLYNLPDGLLPTFASQ
ncbi:lipid asymmetry maintenance protein MlaB [Enterobacteriaceae bacterium H11S18]|uniref:lipid asymmetry maintenance protein MlaB n=1 Tax=Dryocola clanedunensis TaxID=2925396 RepID=UPI0022F12CBF|nr:lipid asymmetry maintenance protein MlaB [Dryocola clanedunensis]MCT4705436.1 lipid asymmetry maintenance protein MlaB [Dryocola clanedunensis]MCT4710010.1 lipid asymmetry maintenance protein MlaB [Dryocola clanedunensis]